MQNDAVTTDDDDLSLREWARERYADAMMQYHDAEPHERTKYESDFDEMLQQERAEAWDECFLAVMKSIRSIAWSDDGSPGNPYREGH